VEGGGEGGGGGVGGRGGRRGQPPTRNFRGLESFDLDVSNLI